MAGATAAITGTSLFKISIKGINSTLSNILPVGQASTQKPQSVHFSVSM